MKFSIYNLILIIILATVLSSCNDDEQEMEEEQEIAEVVIYKGSANINPANVPDGAVLDLSASDTGTVFQLNDFPDVEWDLMIKTFRTGQGGRPGIFLYGDVETQGAVEATNISATGPIGT
ncbi:MAG: hypothetical protein WBA74_09755, partial [Cyclobacteriaceae bacterium]